MPRPLFHLKLTPDELKKLEEFLKIKDLPLSHQAQRMRHRAQAVWFSASKKWPIREIAQHLNAGERSVWRWLKNYQQKGIAGLIDQNKRGLK